jgi:hypothetical protein
VISCLSGRGSGSVEAEGEARREGGLASRGCHADVQRKSTKENSSDQ